MSLASVTGQEQAAAQVKAWLRTARLPHAILVCGPPGSGAFKWGFVATGVVCVLGVGLAGVLARMRPRAPTSR